MAVARAPEKRGTKMVRSAPAPRKSRMLVPTMRPRASRSPSPNFCPSRMVVPMEKELTRPVMVIISWEPTATPDTSAAWAYLPTITRSTAPYRACRNNASRMGRQNLSRGPAMGPFVKSVS